MYYLQSHFGVCVTYSNEQSCQVFYWDELRLFWKIFLFKTTDQKTPIERQQQNQTKSKTAKEKQKNGAEKDFVLMRSCAVLARELTFNGKPPLSGWIASMTYPESIL